MALNVFPREKWRPKPTVGEAPQLQGPVPYVFCGMHTDTNVCLNDDECRLIIYDLQKIHMYYENLPDIRYNFLIANSGVGYECRGWQKMPNLPDRLSQFNDRSVFISYVGPGPHDVGDEGVNDKMRDKFEEIIKWGVANGFIAKKFLLISLKRYEPEVNLFSWTKQPET